MDGPWGAGKLRAEVGWGVWGFPLTQSFCDCMFRENICHGLRIWAPSSCCDGTTGCGFLLGKPACLPSFGTAALRTAGTGGLQVCRQALLVVRHRLARAARPWRFSMAVELGD